MQQAVRPTPEVRNCFIDISEIAHLAKQGVLFVGTSAGMTRSNLVDWPSKATSNMMDIVNWYTNGLGLVAVAKRGHCFAIDIDDRAECDRCGFQRKWLAGYYAVDTPSGGEHYHGLADAITDALGTNAINVYRVKDNKQSGLILELKLHNGSVAAPTAQRIGQEKKCDGIYQPRMPGAMLRHGLDADFVAWLREHGTAMGVTAVHKPSGRGKVVFHPDFDLDEFLEHHDCSEDQSYEADGALWVVVECCPLCGKDARNSTGLAGLTKFVFGGNGYGFICHRCGVSTGAEFEAQMAAQFENWEPWPYIIYREDDDELLFNNDKFPVEAVQDDKPEVRPSVEEVIAFLNGEPVPAVEAAQAVHEPTKADTTEAYTYEAQDTGNGERLVKKFGHLVRWVSETNEWMVWGKKGWRKDSSGTLMRCTKSILEDLTIEAKTLWNDAMGADGKVDNTLIAEAKEVMKHAKASGRLERRKAMVASAGYELGVFTNINDWDGDGWLFNCENGVIEGKTQTFRERTQTDLCMKQSPVAYDPEAKCPMWTGALTKYFCSDQELVNFFQVALGMSLTSDTSQQALFFNQGGGENGKDTVFTVVSYIMGSYWQNVSFTTFAETKYGHSEHRNDLAALAGAVRMVTAAESTDGHALDEAVIKQVTGCSPVTCRQIMGKPFTYTPQYKLWFMSNYEPVIKGQDWGIWRRVKRIPWNYTIQPHEKDPNFTNKLLAEASGILNWMLEGLHKYVAAGCKLPKCKAVDEATAKYREDMDIIGRFEKETVAFQPGASALGCEMYRKYADWCKSNNFFPANSRRFYSEFRKRHPELIERPIKNGAVFEGVGILVDGRYLTGEEGE